MENLEELKKNYKTKFLADQYEHYLNEENKVKEMLAGDPEMREMAEEELEVLKESKEALERQIKDILASEKEEEEFPNEIVLEVRAGAGGDEASLFAFELAEMYERYADKRGWNWKILEESKSDVGGYKEVSLEMRGKDIYKELRYETGVHRVQRIQRKEKNGRYNKSKWYK